MDRLSLRGIRAYGRHGVNPEERAVDQPFDVDLTIDIDLAAAGRSDDLTDTLDYARLHERLVAVVAGTSFALLERLAEELLVAVFEEPRVVRAEVTVAKPNVLRGATPSITLARTNQRRSST
ncbi:MAG: dihydroneopterin aldolase [Candidatus Tumulicola sp.]